ncbi:hypothetical protein ACFYN3_36010 [Streptomyces lavendulae]|uniref:hypothetical protein n=1 Tax=Streptomyces lavendulae TaxID=1914 RepID=UPI00367ECE27
MTHRLFRRSATMPGIRLSSEDQVVVDAFRVMLAAPRTPERWTPGSAQDVAVRVGAHIERARIRPGDDLGPDVIAVALVHPDTPHAAAYAHRYTRRGWLRCETAAILDLWRPAYNALTHAAAGLDLPVDVGMPAAHYGVDIQAHPSGVTVLRLGPYNQTWHTSRDTDRLTAELEGQTAVIAPGFTVTATSAAFDFGDRESYRDPYRTDLKLLLASALAEARM